MDQSLCSTDNDKVKTKKRLAFFNGQSKQKLNASFRIMVKPFIKPVLT
jgi:hypothetical protein